MDFHIVVSCPPFCFSSVSRDDFATSSQFPLEFPHLKLNNGSPHRFPGPTRTTEGASASSGRFGTNDRDMGPRVWEASPPRHGPFDETEHIKTYKKQRSNRLFWRTKHVLVRNWHVLVKKPVRFCPPLLSIGWKAPPERLDPSGFLACAWSVPRPPHGADRCRGVSAPCQEVRRKGSFRQRQVDLVPSSSFHFLDK